ncbi:MAG: MerR family transcriptional regulator [Trichormus sp. ATA11-4-KO1]|jgi:MerR family Zn(II)-responsive transcriptional regulator of zntA|nr:MerR family transcriptional regulator [Trichormus sp. ATA11-4-KO1]
MLIGELVQKTGLSRDTIRFYEKIGLVSPSQRKARSGYKDYSDATIERLLLITQAKALGFTLCEIKQGINAWQDGEFSQDEKIQIMQDKIAQVNEKIQQLNNIKTYLMGKLDKVKRGIL